MEIEAKFAVPDEATLNRLAAMEQLAGYTLLPGETKRMRDKFMDTLDYAVLKSGHVCRQRDYGDHLVMSLKSGHTVEGGVHRREELEVTLPRPRAIVQWPDSEIRTKLLGLIGDVPLASMCDQRQTRVVRMLQQADRIVAEFSADRVELSRRGRQVLYFEVEVELKESGTEDDLAAMVRGLIDEWGLQPEARSKFERALEFSREAREGG
jgi:inorganic triphosphatase YgiF